MEFAVAAFSTVAGVALSKLCSVKGKLNTDATIISEELKWIEAAMKDHASSVEPMSFLQAEYFAQLRALAYDIQDCIDSFNAKMTTDDEFADKIAQLKERSTATTERIKRFGFPVQGAAAQAAAAAVPAEIQNFHFLMRGGNLNGDYHNCLLYLRLFPHEHHVRTKPLERRWTAEGLVPGEQGAASNLGMLVGSSIIRSTQRSSNGKVKRCQPTGDAIWQYITQRSMSENFIWLSYDVAELQNEHLRRLSVHACANAHLNLPQSLSLLRTLAVFSTGAAATLDSYEAVLDFTKYKLLRVLDLKECAHLSAGHIQAIYSLVLMKYLSIKSGIIDRLPREIWKLNQLETLDLSGSGSSECDGADGIVTVYKEVLLLPRLKHLIGKFELSGTDTIWAPVPSDVEKFLKAHKSMLETLAGFVTGQKVGFPQLMSLMRRLRKVKIWCEPNAKRRNLHALSSAITKFIRDGPGEPHLSRSLSINFQGSSGRFTSDIDPVPGILAALKLQGKLGQFPPFVSQLSSIDELCLCSTGLSWEDIRAGLSYVDIQGELICVGGLKYLKLIENEDTLGPIVIQPDHLKSIKRLSIVCKPRLDITIQAGALPDLVSLHILCETLDVLPGTPGIEIAHMNQLDQVELHPQVQGGIRAQWQLAVDGHNNRPVPVLLFVEEP